MAQVNITLSQEEILQLLLTKNASEAFRQLLQSSLNQFLSVESATQLGADPYERTDGLFLSYSDLSSISLQRSLPDFQKHCCIRIFCCINLFF